MATARFEAQQTFAAGDGPDSIAVADFNGDGKPDLVVEQHLLRHCERIARATGTARLQPPQSYATGPGPDWVVAADLTGDGITDLVAANSDGTISVLAGQWRRHVPADGRFSPATSRVSPWWGT